MVILEDPKFHSSCAIFFAFGAMQFNFYHITEKSPFISDPYLAHSIEEKVMEPGIPGLNHFSTISSYFNLLFSFLQVFFCWCIYILMKRRLQLAPQQMFVSGKIRKSYINVLRK